MQAATKRTQPYRSTMDRGPSPVLAKMQAGRIAGPSMGGASSPRGKRRPPFPHGLRGVRIPRA